MIRRSTHFFERWDSVGSSKTKFNPSKLFFTWFPANAAYYPSDVREMIKNSKSQRRNISFFLATCFMPCPAPSPTCALIASASWPSSVIKTLPYPTPRIAPTKPVGIIRFQETKACISELFAKKSRFILCRGGRKNSTFVADALPHALQKKAAPSI